MALFGSWLDNLFGNQQQGAPMPAGPAMPSAQPAPAPDAISLLSKMQYQKPELWRQILGAVGGGLSDYSAFKQGRPGTGISDYFGGIDRGERANLASNATNEVLGNLSDPSKANDALMQIAKLQAMGVDTGPITSYFQNRKALEPTYTRDDSGNVFVQTPGQPPQLFQVGPGKPTTVGHTVAAINPYSGSGAPPVGAPAPSAAPSPQASAPAGPQLEDYISKTFPGSRVTSGPRTVAQNTAVGGVPNSAHLSDNARDFVPPPGVTIEQAAAHFNSLGIPGLKAIAEGPGAANSTGPHVHVQYVPQGGSAAATAPARSNVLYDAGPDWRDATPAEKAQGIFQVNTSTGEKKPMSSDQRGSMMFDPNGSATQSNLTGDAYLKTLDPKIATQVKALSLGKMAFPTGFALRSPYWQNMLQAVAQYDPSFDAVNYNARSKTRNDFTSGKSAQNITAMNTALQHAGVVSDALGKLNNGTFPMWNSVANYISQETGNPAPGNAREAIDALASEGRKVFAASGGGNLTELENWQKNFPINGSPAQQQGALKQFAQLLYSRLDAVGQQYDRGMGTTSEPLKLLSPHAQATFAQLTGSAAPQAAPQGPPSGAKRLSPAEAAKLPKGTPFLTLDGRQRVKN